MPGGIGGHSSRPRPTIKAEKDGSANGSGGPQEFNGRENLQAGEGISEAQHTLDVSKPPKLMIRFGGNQG